MRRLPMSIAVPWGSLDESGLYSERRRPNYGFSTETAMSPVPDPNHPPGSRTILHENV